MGSALELDGLDEASLTALARRVADVLRPGDVVVLRGEVGAGKTTFVRAVAGDLGVREAVTSPTYQFARRYGGRLGDGSEVRLNHLDLYRLEGLDPWDALDFDEYVDGDSVTFVEWAEPALGALPEPSVVELFYEGPQTRRVLLSGPLVERLGTPPAS